MDDTEVLASLRRLGGGWDAEHGFRTLCTMASVCTVCLQRWTAESKCGCS